MARYLVAALEARATVIIEVDPETNHISRMSEELPDKAWKKADGTVKRSAIQNLYAWDTDEVENTLNDDYWVVYFTQETPDSPVVEVEPVPNPQWVEGEFYV